MGGSRASSISRLSSATVRSRSSFTTSTAPSSTTVGDLFVALGQAALDRVGLVAAASQPLGLGLAAGGDEQHEQGLGRPLLHLRRALHVDLEDQVAARGQVVRGRRAVQVAEELGVLEEAAGGQARLERVAVDVGVGVGRFAGTSARGSSRTGSTTAAGPVRRVVGPPFPSRPHQGRK